MRNSTLAEAKGMEHTASHFRVCATIQAQRGQGHSGSTGPTGHVRFHSESEIEHTSSQTCDCLAQRQSVFLPRLNKARR